MFPRWSPNLTFHLVKSKEDTKKSHPQEGHRVPEYPSSNSEHELKEFFQAVLLTF